MWAEPTFISALCEAGPSVGLPPCPFGAKQRRRLWNRSCADSAPVRRAILRGWRSCAEGSLPQTALLCGGQSSADSAPVRRAILRGQRPLQMHDPYRLQPTQTAFLHGQYASTASEFYPDRHTVSRQECFK